MSIEGESTSVASFSSAPSSSIGSFSSFETSGLSGGMFNPSTSFADFAPMTSEYISPISLDTGFVVNQPTEIPSVFEIGLADINLDPDVPEYQIPQAFYDAFEKPSAEEFTPPSYLESIPRLAPSFDKLRTPLAQDYSLEPTFIEMPELAEISAEILEAPSLEILDRKIEELVPDLQPIEEVFNEATIVEEIIQSEVVATITDENIIQEIIPESVPFDSLAQDNSVKEIVPAIIIGEAAENLVSLAEAPPILPDSISEPIVIPNAIQAATTLESLKVAGIEEAQATELVRTALIQSGIEPEAAEQILTQITQQTKTAVEEQIMVDEIEIPEREKEERQERKTEYKFVVDEKALAERESALGKALDKAPLILKDGKETVDIYQVIAGLPTESEKPAVISEILDQPGIPIVPDGDESYREAVNALWSLDQLSKEVIFRRGREIFEKLPPVKISETGKAVKEIDVERVLSSKLDPILKTKNFITYNIPNNN